MKCAILSLIVTMTLMVFTPMTALACHDAPGGQQDAGDSGSGNTGSSGSGGSGKGANDTSTGGSTGTGKTGNDGNGPSNFQLIDCSDPFWHDFLPCFERMVKEREVFVSQPGKED